MPRPLIRFEDSRQKQQTRSADELLLHKPKAKSAAKLSPMEVERVLNRRRSKEYVEAMTRLDAGGHMHNQRQVEEMIEVIRRELPEIEIESGPIGIVSKCYLGAPYEVHTLDVAGAIIEHYETFRPLPGMLERARKLAKGGYYAFIEVYPFTIRAVKTDGTVATLKG